MKPKHILHLPKIPVNFRKALKSQGRRFCSSQGEIRWFNNITFLLPPSLQNKQSLIFQLHSLWLKQKIKAKRDLKKFHLIQNFKTLLKGTKKILDLRF